MSDSSPSHRLQHARLPCPSPISLSLAKFMPIQSMMPSNHLILCCPLLLLPSIFHSIRVFSNKSTVHIRWPKHWSFSFIISPSKEDAGLISFKIDWFGLPAFQGTLKSLLQNHSSAFWLLSCPARTSAYDYWQDHSPDYMDLCWQRDVFAF